jgi:macrodomain Ter protein organizer (MatP/YcbG family)
MGVPNVDDDNKEGSNVTRSLARRATANKAENVRDVSKQSLLLITWLEKDLHDQIFSQSDKEMIVDTRLITDLKTTVVRMKSIGAILISYIERAKYITSLCK